MSDVKTAMERFWDERAREDAFHYVDNRTALGAPDREAFWRDGEEVVERMLELLGADLSGDETLLEIGCGIGRLTRALAARVRSVSALDVSKEMLVQARDLNQGLTNVRWIHGDGVSLSPLANASFDACISFVVFQHIPDPRITQGYIREMGRVLKPGGWAAFQVSNDPRIHRRPPIIRRLGSALRPLRNKGPRGQTDPSWVGSALTIDELRAAARDGGLRLERVENPGELFCLVLARRA